MLERTCQVALGMRPLVLVALMLILAACNQGNNGGGPGY